MDTWIEHKTLGGSNLLSWKWIWNYNLHASSCITNDGLSIPIH